MQEDRRLCILAFSAISHGYIRDLWPDFDSISRRGLFTYWHPEYVRARLMLHIRARIVPAVLSRGFIYCAIEMRRREWRDDRATRNSKWSRDWLDLGFAFAHLLALSRSRYNLIE